MEMDNRKDEYILWMSGKNDYQEMLKRKDEENAWAAKNELGRKRVKGKD
jgi:hypothetical protein